MTDTEIITENAALKSALEKSNWMLRCYRANARLNGMLKRGTVLRPAVAWADEAISESEALLKATGKHKE